MSELFIVLLPGLDGTGKMFRPFLNCLPEHLKPIIVSYPVDMNYGYEELLPIVMSFLPKNKDFIILGESFSGPLAVLAAHKNPPGLKGLVLCATFVSNPFVLLPSWFSFLSVGPIYSLWPVIIKIRALFHKGDNYHNLIHDALAAISSVKPGVIAKRVKAILQVNVEKELRECKVPILYIESTEDYLIRNRNVRKINSSRNDVRVAKIETSHFVLQLAPREAVKEIEKFISDIIPYA